MDYDRSIHNNPDAQAWAKFFIETTKDIDREVFGIEGYMTAWFSDAMMAMHDSMKPQEAAAKYKELREATTDLLNAIDGLFPSDGPVKARVRAALKEKE
jgi:hypothetical protein